MEVKIHLHLIQLQLYVCYKRYAKSTSAQVWLRRLVATLALLSCWDLALVICFSAGILFGWTALVLGSCLGNFGRYLA